ncbi:MAG: 4-hydroxythreonine-4-phosphate dehydrogenase PdxA [Halioglobus sp.]
MAVPRIAITPGEPAGIGPDIVLRAAQENWPAQLVAIADPELLSQRAQTLGLDISLSEFSPATEQSPHQAGSLLVYPVSLKEPAKPGTLNSANARYVLDTLEKAVALCSNNTCQAMVTGPVQKSVINEAGVHFIGHTEFLQQQTHTAEVVMMLATSKLRVALATTHLALQDVPSAITRERLTDTLRILHNDLVSKFAIDSPCIAVLGLNPHAGEDGHMGREEIDTIIPVMEQLRGEGMNLLGPLPADTAFNPKVLDSCDAVFAMYHDQGLPVLKYSGFGQAINITLGLPIIRTSVDHGTALDLAGSGTADWRSLEQAIVIASQLAVQSR